MKVYWYWPNPFVAGHPMAEALSALGEELVVHSLATRDARPIERQVAGYEVVRGLPETLPRSRRRWALDRLAIYRERARLRRALVEERGFDVCHLFQLNHWTDGRALRRLGRRTALVSTVHDVVPHHRRLPAWVERRLLRATYRHAGTLVVAHRWLADRLRAEFGVAAERIRVIPPPIEAPPGGLRARAAEAAPGAPVRVLFFGQLRDNKGIPDLLEAARLLAGEAALSFHLAGRGEPALEAAVRGAAGELEHLTCELGYVPAERKAELFGAADLVVLPYRRFASQSAVLGDAYTHAVPVVATDCGAMGMTVREDRTGWLVPPGDPGALAEALRAAARDLPERRRIAGTMLELQRRHDVAAVARALRELYREAASTASTQGSFSSGISR
ncbi:MAG TPA: glycosyltransferase family 4 protein [Thermoanaerobaculia bacterium]|nr:glycosyltransferase family 4 protein [Thermoanaerobaculia bacterium]